MSESPFCFFLCLIVRKIQASSESCFFALLMQLQQHVVDDLCDQEIPC